MTSLCRCPIPTQRCHRTHRKSEQSSGALSARCISGGTRSEGALMSVLLTGEVRVTPDEEAA